jgi:hypothetical protein
MRVEPILSIEVLRLASIQFSETSNNEANPFNAP